LNVVWLKYDHFFIAKLIICLVWIFIQSYLNIKLHLSTLLVSMTIIGSTHAIWC
jgi:hypothetical protein